MLQDDEYAIYSVTQQRIRYIVEFTVSGDAAPVERGVAFVADTENECKSAETRQPGLFFCRVVTYWRRNWILTLHLLTGVC